MSNVTALKIEPDSSQLEIIRDKVDTASKDWTLKSVPKLIAARGLSAFELGGRLNRVYEQKLWPDADNVSFVKWMDKQGIQKSRGYALMDTYRAIVCSDLPFDILETIGWSKLVMIVPLLKPHGTDEADKHNAELIKTAEHSTQLQLRKAVGEAKGKKAKGKKAKGKKAKPKPDIVEKLRSIMQKFQPEDVLKMFAELWPDIDIKVTL